MITNQIELSGENKRFFISKSHKRLLIGPSGSGKTFAGMLLLNSLCIKYPNIKCLLARKSLPALRNSAVKTLDYIIDLTHSSNQVRVLGETRPTHYIYKNGSEISLSTIDTKGMLLGAEYDIVYIHDPCSEGLTLDEFMLVTSRARRNGLENLKVIVEGTIPFKMINGDKHWIYELPSLGFEVFNPSLKDNPQLFNWTEMGKQYINNLNSISEKYKSVLLEGKWEQ